ncbi:MAG: hypothetical protein ACXQTS_03600 [Candidatus Methanospirareceae archaeon]
MVGESGVKMPFFISAFSSVRVAAGVAILSVSGHMYFVSLFILLTGVELFVKSLQTHWV